METQVTFLDTFVKLFGINGLWDYQTKICTNQFKNEEQLIENVNRNIPEIKKHFKLSGLNLARKKYVLDSVPLCFNLLKNLLKQTKVPYDIVRDNKYNYVRLSEPNILLYKDIHNMEDTKHNVDNIIHDQNQILNQQTSNPMLDIIRKNEQTEKEIMKRVEDSISPEPTDLIEFLNTFEDKKFFDHRNPQFQGNHDLILFSSKFAPEEKNIYWLQNPYYWTVLPDDTCFILSENSPNKIEYHLMIPRTCDVIKDIDYILVDKNGEVIQDFKDSLISTHFKIGEKILKNHSPTTLLPLFELCYQKSFLVLNFPEELFQKLNNKYPQFNIILKFKFGILGHAMRKYLIKRPNLKLYNYFLKNGIWFVPTNQDNSKLAITDNKVKTIHRMFFTEKPHTSRYQIPKSEQFINNFRVSILDLEGKIYANIINYVKLSAGPYTISETQHDYENPKYIHKITLSEDFPNDLLSFTDVWIEFFLFQPLNQNQYVDIRYDTYSYRIPYESLKQHKGIVYNKKFFIVVNKMLDPPILQNNNSKIEIGPLHPNEKDDYPNLSDLLPDMTISSP